jgi:hypothetical protein
MLPIAVCPQGCLLPMSFCQENEPRLVLLGFHSGQNAAINGFGPATMKIEFIPCDASGTYEFKLT